MFLRLQDYYSVIRSEQLTEILQGDDSLRTTTELQVQEHIRTLLRHRYDMVKTFPDLLDYDPSTRFTVGDVVSYSETAYSSATDYIIGDRVSYSGYIYECIQDSTDNLPTNTAYWSLVTKNENLFTCLVTSLGNTPDSAIAFTPVDFLRGFESLVGWNKTLPLYGLVKEDSISLYISPSDRTSDRNILGYIQYDEKPLKLPSRRPVIQGNNQTTTLAGYLVISDFAQEGDTFTLTATNYFEQNDSRNQMLVRIMTKMVVYELHNVINPRNIPQLRVDGYTEALNLLEQIAKGKVTADLPIHEKEPEKGQRIHWGISSDAKYRR